jgi:hypothetical protein
MLHYKKKDDNKSNEEAYAVGCCTPPEGSGTPADCDCCFDTWTKELRVTSNQFKHWDAKVNKLTQICTFESAWKDKLKSWLDDLTTADDKSNDVARQIVLFINQLNKICVVTTESIKAINILFFLVKDLYTRVDRLKADYDELINCINNAGKSHPELGAGSAILICLTEYGKKLQAVIDTRNNMIQSVAAAIEIAHKLQEYLCIDERHADYSLIDILKYWKEIFNGDKAHNHGPCPFDPLLTFPIKSSDYFNTISSRLADVTNRLTGHKKELDYALDKKAGFQASRDGLTRALAEADPAIKCK